MFACSICPNKEYKTQSALKGHNTKCHKNITVIVESIPLVENIPVIVESIQSVELEQ